MAERRMFAKTIIDSDAFLDMPLSTQSLYFHLSMRADDDGFINNPRKIQRMIGASDDDLKLLIAKQYLLTFDTGVIVIRHWKMHNYIRSDRYKPTVYTEERSLLDLTKTGIYNLVSKMDTIGIPSGRQTVYQMDTQSRLGQDSLGKVNSSSAPTLEQVEEYCRKKNYKTSAKAFFEYYSERHWEINGDPIRDWKALLGTWEKREQEKGKPNPRNSFNNFNQRSYNEEQLESMLLNSN